MAYFPLFIDISGRKCVVVGGGKVAERKVDTLLSYGGMIRVISPEISPEILRKLAPASDTAPSGHELIKKILTEQELERELADAVLVVAASGSRQANHQAAMICRRRGIPVNVVDAPEECTFLFPAVVKKGEISIGINTGGQSPIVSSVIRKETEENVPDYYAAIAGQLGELRARIRESVGQEKLRRQILKKLASAAFLKERPLNDEEINTIINMEKQPKPNE